MSTREDSLTVADGTMSERIDIYLRTHFPVVSRGTLQRLIQEGHIKVNGEIVKPNFFIKGGQVISVRWPTPKALEVVAENIPLEILFEDSDMIVINKPPGLVVHPGAGHDEHTLVNALLHHCDGQLSGIGGVARPGIVHRLDRDTSGCLLVAKNDVAHLHLSAQFAARTIEKKYHAIVCGNPPLKSGEIRAAIARHPSHRKRMAVPTNSQGREAWTSYKVLERFTSAAWVEAILHTGRTHQIRVHFQHLGFPLVGDEVYGLRQNKNLHQKLNLIVERQMLHAFEVGFTHPTKSTRLSFTAPLPGDFLTALEACRKTGIDI